jgi:crotonobetainyl-CoA:carnitine CoA-transferase CaiB-like acyl-CoA transferase
VKPRTIVSLEQALTLPYCTQRLAHLGWRVIRVESTPLPGQRTPGDPNRYVGPPVAGPDRCAYFLPPNAGKEAITLDLKATEGQALLGRLLRDLPADVFAVNTLPGRYEKLGVSYDQLARFRPDLIWVGISSLGPAYPDFPGYDPALQALCGYMSLTGEADGPPLLSGVPLVDLKAGDEAFSQILLALVERAETGRGKRIDVSMAQAAVSWLVTQLPQLELGKAPPGRTGNEHREFVPVNAYPTRDGFVYLAVGNDRQWAKLTEIPGFEGLAAEGRRSNAGRQAERGLIHEALREITATRSTAELSQRFTHVGLVHAPIQPLDEVARAPWVERERPSCPLPDGRELRLAPPATSPGGAPAAPLRLGPPPGYGEHTTRILAEIGLAEADLEGLRQRGIIT